MTNGPIHRQLADTAIAAELRLWRRAHPEATLTEIERALDARLTAARAGLLAEVSGDAPDDDPRCSTCGERLERVADLVSRPVLSPAGTSGDQPGVSTPGDGPRPDT